MIKLDMTMTNSPPTLAAYGSWQSPITASALTAQTLRISEPCFDGDDIYWLESRPNEKGRIALVQLTADGSRHDLLPMPHSLRTRANEYGGGAYTVAGGIVYLVLDADQRIYRLNTTNADLQALSPEGCFRYADFCIDQQHQRLICVREDYSNASEEARCEIIALYLDGTERIEVLVSGADFYSNPRLSPDGTLLSWLCWQHPQMPWDGTECWIAQLNTDGILANAKKIVGGPSESIFQPRWSPGGDLIFVSDRTNWWNVYRWRNTVNSSTGKASDISEELESLCEVPAEFATPQWVFGMSTYDFLDRHNLLCCYNQQGQWQLATIDLRSKQFTTIVSDLTDISAITCHAGHGLLLGANAQKGVALYRYSASSKELTAIAQSSQHQLPAALVSTPQPISFNTSDNETAHGFYYPPLNPEYIAPEQTLPPLLVTCHGGPTGATESSLSVKIQYWTSRGFAVLDVNYRGSTGYGRAYRDRLKNNWGVTDVIDVCSGADYLIAKGLVDEQKLAIRGSSAGGYTVLAALTFSNRFNAGASLYGIGNLETLAQDTHKFESRYLDSLVGKYPEEKVTYQARSPINHIEQLRCPVIFLQGLLDKVVPPNQAEAMVKALSDKGIATAYITFAEEGHGFRQAANIERAIEAELYFYSKIFNFELAETISPVQIKHLQELTQ